MLQNKMILISETLTQLWLTGWPSMPPL